MWIPPRIEFMKPNTVYGCSDKLLPLHNNNSHSSRTWRLRRRKKGFLSFSPSSSVFPQPRRRPHHAEGPQIGEMLNVPLGDDQMKFKLFFSVHDQQGQERGRGTGQTNYILFANTFFFKLYHIFCHVMSIGLLPRLPHRAQLLRRRRRRQEGRRKERHRRQRPKVHKNIFF